ncbi:sugar transferase [Deefgea salmonis]|uniref:Sugar transferase n=1 Tax=Deefgea salmonis TaxID=2875502 RepID=A0ABS8BNA2_9NEIS|nr:sugar transferase [Deefgea salmonis]MCB5197195.1 sugar transferase [Deefgea salmonis]
MNSPLELSELKLLEKRYSRLAIKRWRVRLLRARLRLSLYLVRFVRRAWDTSAVVMALLFAWPVWLCIACAIKLTDGGPVLYWQRRVGYRGELFDFPKFRSMVVNAESLQSALASQHQDSYTFKLARDPRVTWIGRLIRRLSLDEFPQLWCVLKGEMTLVGPRPPLPKEVAQYGLYARQRLEIKPGLTCIWQVSGRAEVAFMGQLEMDLDYIRRRSLALDMRILLKTIPAVVFGRGAY